MVGKKDTVKFDHKSFFGETKLGISIRVRTSTKLG